MKNKGFSLVELIVVIAIMAILVGVAVPVYTSYIEKANKAKDEQLLGEINSAFNVVLAGNAIDINTVTKADIPVENGVVDLSGMTVNGAENATIENAMIEILGTDLEFNVIEEIWYDESVHKFVDDTAVEYDYNGTPIFLSPSDIAALKNSTYGTVIGVKDLLGKVDFVTLLSASLLESVGSNSTFAQLINGPEYGSILADFLGIDLSADGGQAEFMAKVGSLVDAKMDLLIANGDFSADADRTEGSELYNAAYYQIVANNAVMNAAKNSNAISSDFLTVLGGENAKGAMLQTVNTEGKSGEGLAQVSTAYALYTAYAAKNNLAVPENPADVLVALDNDKGFKDYVNDVDGSGQAQKDLEGYLGAMNMVNSNVESNTDAVEDILVNGFANDSLVDLMEDATK